MVERQRSGDVSLGGKSNQADAVARAVSNKATQNFLDHLKTVGRLAFQLKISGAHAAGEVDGDNNIDAAGCDFGFAFGDARLSQRDDTKRQYEPAKNHQKT